MADQLVLDLTQALEDIPLIDPHSHIDPLNPVSRSLDDILGYHYYTELAHSAGMSQAPLAKDVPGRERVRAILQHIERFDNTLQYSWFAEIVKSFLGMTEDQISADNSDRLYDRAEKIFAQSDWEEQVFKKSNLEAIFLTNEFDDPLEDFDTSRYVPCLRTDALVFRLQEREIQIRLARATGVEVHDGPSLKRAIRKLFEQFLSKNAKACAISLPPNFSPKADAEALSPAGIFWVIAEHCREYKLPFDLMIGVNRQVYRNGVYQGQDLFDQRVSLLQYAELFNAFPQVTFPISVLCSNSNQELVSHAWIFPNVVTNGHWWYSNIPAYIHSDLKSRLQAVPKTKQIAYYSDAYKLEFVLPKFGMYRRVLANVLAEDFVRSRGWSENQAVELGKRLLRDNVREIFKI
ncbi:glucuronate isomerase [Telmatocola sphagniphila]|uniref:Glucuronate isomerase n=1 Tax=Telmatocola sphagniphila TaxID=1123043 RepID=A0A8E6B9U4_9BACT|nr:glucuronate isomerase [Telmatocola sphagniphila]QVL34468.1 glucuronate isomerase [Telmatocola sphagniphila]